MSHSEDPRKRFIVHSRIEAEPAVPEHCEKLIRAYAAEARGWQEQPPTNRDERIYINTLLGRRYDILHALQTHTSQRTGYPMDQITSCLGEAVEQITETRDAITHYAGDIGDRQPDDFAEATGLQHHDDDVPNGISLMYRWFKQGLKEYATHPRYRPGYTLRLIVRGDINKVPKAGGGITALDNSFFNHPEADEDEPIPHDAVVPRWVPEDAADTADYIGPTGADLTKGQDYLRNEFTTTMARRVQVSLDNDEPLFRALCDDVKAKSLRTPRDLLVELMILEDAVEQIDRQLPRDQAETIPEPAVVTNAADFAATYHPIGDNNYFTVLGITAEELASPNGLDQLRQRFRLHFREAFPEHLVPGRDMFVEKESRLKLIMMANDTLRHPTNRQRYIESLAACSEKS